MTEKSEKAKGLKDNEVGQSDVDEGVISSDCLVCQGDGYITKSVNLKWKGLTPYDMTAHHEREDVECKKCKGTGLEKKR